MSEIVNFVINIVDWLWYIWIFIMMTIESSFIPFPSEVAMVPAWYLASTWKMNFFLALLSWTLGALFWSIINYYLWKYFWWKIIHKMIKIYWKYIFLNLKHYEKSEKYFKKHWSITTFLGRFIPAVRQLISIPAWIFNMNMAKFLLFTWLWAGLWNLILMTIWYIAWENKGLIEKYSFEALIWVLIFWTTIWIIYYFKKWKDE